VNISFRGETVLVTGATRGIGAALADAFEASGARLLLTGTDEIECRDLTASAARDGRDRRYFAVDFSIPASFNRFLDEVLGLERVDVCVNNAGINRINALIDVSEDDLDAMFAINLRAPILVSQAATAVMARAGYGRVVNVGSVWNTVSKPKRSIYSAMKTGVHGLTIGTAVELASQGILVNTVSPGFVMTDLTKENNSSAQIAVMAEQIPLGRLASPHEIAGAILFLASGANTYVTGQNLVVDGGFTHV
jgi:NAD(P)-dependent dehydrogenase (short-subunit alcohol dehydrogenase family)